MGEVKRRQDLGLLKPKKPNRKRHAWKVVTPSKYVRWLFVGPVMNRAAKRKRRKQLREMTRQMALKEQRESAWKAWKLERMVVRAARDQRRYSRLDKQVAQ